MVSTAKKIDPFWGNQIVQIKPDQTVQGEDENLDSAEVGSEGSLDSAGSGNCGPNSTEPEPWLEARSHR